MASGLGIAIAQAVLGKLGEIATEKVLNEAFLLLNFRKDFKWLQKKFSLLSIALKDADTQNVSSDTVKQWLADVRDIALDVEDLIDECAVEHLYTNPSQTCVCSWSQLMFRRKMGKRIKSLKGRVSSIIQDGHDLKLFHDLPRLDKPSTSGRSAARGAQVRRGSVMLEKGEGAVGVEEKAEEIERLLEQPSVGVVAVVGMGGLGKTFLVQHIYNRNKQKYDHSAWISVSQTCSARSLQSDLAYQTKFQILDAGISDVLVSDLIHRHLEDKKCLIVLDDVWSNSLEGNINIIQTLGLSTGHCKILVTTRSRNVAAGIRAHVYDLQLLSEDNSWKLFCLFAAFPMPSKDLESLVHQIVEKCGGLPLAIKTVAASMSNSVAFGDWEAKLKQLKNVQGRKEKDSTMQILKLSYDSLPSHLKPCFAYLSFFPEDTQIRFYRNVDPKSIYQDLLIYLWIAEGFIPRDNEEDQWDTGLAYLHQLVNLCLVDISTVRASYTIHDLLRDLAIEISKEQQCLFHLRSQETGCRRLLLGKKGITDGAVSEASLHRHQLLRTLSLFQNPGIESIPEHLFDCLRLRLRVLDLSSTAISELPKSVGNLKLLKLLNLSHTKIRKLPECVRRLKSLRFLDVSGCTALERVPHWIGDLISLSHLDIRSCSGELYRQIPRGISMLLSLRTLRTDEIPISSVHKQLLNVGDIGKLINLQEIAISLEDEGVLTSLEDGVLEQLGKMRILAVRNNISAREGEILPPAFPQKINVMKDVRELSLGRFTLPSWICEMGNLEGLLLTDCSDYPSLQTMPNLQRLALKGDGRVRALPAKFGKREGFPKLVRLFLIEFSLLEELPVLEEGGMQRLEGLWINNCPRLKKVSEGWELLKSLKLIEVVHPSGELRER